MVFMRIAALIAEQFGLDDDEVTEELTFEELGADEIDVSELAKAAEDEFDIELRDEEIADLEDVSDLVKLVKTAVALSR